MTIPQLIAALRLAIWQNNIDRTSSLIDELEVRMGPAKAADLLEDILGEGPVVSERDACVPPILVACA